jgi:ATP adenylyltransferase
MQVLFTPWRYAYITGQHSAGCFLCEAAASPEEPDRLVVHVTAHHLVLLNRHPYSNGHLMVAPRRHVADPAMAEAAARDEIWPLVLLAQRVLGSAYRPDGLNVGMNLGKVAGAGVPDHYHLHVVPRWEGDTNFMTATADTRLVPEDLLQTRERLRPLFAHIGAETAA